MNTKNEKSLPREVDGRLLDHKGRYVYYTDGSARVGKRDNRGDQVHADGLCYILVSPRK